MVSRQKKHTRKLSFLNKLVYFLNLLTVITLVLSLISVYVSPLHTWWPSLFGLAFPYLALLNILFVFYWLLIGKRQFLLSLIFLLIGWTQVGNYIQFGQNTIEAGNSQFKVMSFNTHNLSDNNIGTIDEKARERNFAFLINESPQIICLQEFFTRSNEFDELLENIGSNTGASFHHSDVYFKSNGRNTNSLVTLSTFPIIEKGTLRHSNKKAFCLISDIVVYGRDTISVYNVHLQSVHLLQRDLDFVNEITSQTGSDDLKSRSKSILWKLREAFQNRAEQVKILKEHIDNCPFPVVICGDFNDTPTSFAYRQLSINLKDSFKENGKGIGFTYSGAIRAPLRLDYILYDKGLKGTDFVTHKVKLSDHYPISIKLFAD